MNKCEIEFQVIPDQERPAFPGKYFGNPLFDLNVFKVADKLLPNYSGGMWEYVNVLVTKVDYVGDGVASESVNSHPIFKLPGVTSIENPFSGEVFEVDANLAGLIVTCYTVNWRNESLATNGKLEEAQYNQWFNLQQLCYEYAGQTGQSQQAFGMLD